MREEESANKTFHTWGGLEPPGLSPHYVCFGQDLGKISSAQLTNCARCGL